MLKWGRGISIKVGRRHKVKVGGGGLLLKWVKEGHTGKVGFSVKVGERHRVKVGKRHRVKVGGEA